MKIPLHAGPLEFFVKHENGLFEALTGHDAHLEEHPPAWRMHLRVSRKAPTDSADPLKLIAANRLAEDLRTIRWLEFHDADLQRRLLESIKPDASTPGQLRILWEDTAPIDFGVTLRSEQHRLLLQVVD